MTYLTSSPTTSSEVTGATASQPQLLTYQAPAIESVFTSDDMTREVLYAGNPTSDNTDFELPTT